MKVKLFLAVVVAALAVVPAAFANTTTSPAHPSISVSPAPVAMVPGGYMTFTVCGFDPNGDNVAITDLQPSSGPGLNLDSISFPIPPLDSQGCFTAGPDASDSVYFFTQDIGPGSYHITAVQDKAAAGVNFTLKK